MVRPGKAGSKADIKNEKCRERHSQSRTKVSQDRKDSNQRHTAGGKCGAENCTGYGESIAESGGTAACVHMAEQLGRKIVKI